MLYSGFGFHSLSESQLFRPGLVYSLAASSVVF
jgi:hypothetical protein